MVLQTLITLKFIGTAYHGFQVQENAFTVCEALQNAMEKLYGVRPNIKGCSRTDSGVHALDYCVSYTQPKPIELRRLPLAINRFLPEDIRVMSAREVNQSFHARYDAISKEYQYRILNSSIQDPFLNGLAWRCPSVLNLENMQKATEFFVGKQDFASFMSAGSKIESTVRTIHFLTVNKCENQIVIHINADGYLYNMVRIIVGTLIDVGTGKYPPEHVKEIINAKDRGLAGDTAPACGLYLYKVNYGE